MIKKILILLLALYLPQNSFAIIEVDITRGNLDPLPLAVSPLSIDEKSKNEFQKNLETISCLNYMDFIKLNFGVLNQIKIKLL